MEIKGKTEELLLKQLKTSEINMQKLTLHAPKVNAPTFIKPTLKDLKTYTL
jgi:hypothetical protein